MLSRVADSLFWLGRYIERAENYSRFIDVNFNLSLDLPSGISEQWDPLITASGDRELFISQYGSEFTRQNAMFFMGFDTTNPNSIISSINMARENARIIRENIPKENWEVLNSLYHFVQEASKKMVWKKEDPSDVFEQIKLRVQAFNGVAYDTIPRTQGWFFGKMGQYLERADKTSRILDVKYHYLLPSGESVGSPLDFLHWAALLKSVSGYNAYRRMYGKIDPASIVEYLTLNKYFPRSILFCLVEAENCMHEISESKRGYSNKAEKSIGSLRADIEYADINDLFQSGLHEYLNDIQLKLNDISQSVYDQYFKIQSNFESQNANQ